MVEGAAKSDYAVKVKKSGAESAEGQDQPERGEPCSQGSKSSQPANSQLKALPLPGFKKGVKECVKREVPAKPP